MRQRTRHPGRKFDLECYLREGISRRTKVLLLIVQVPYVALWLGAAVWFFTTLSASHTFSWLVIVQACLLFFGAWAYLNVYPKHAVRWLSEMSNQGTSEGK